MNLESTKKVTNQAIEELVNALNAGHSEALRQYLSAMAKFRTYSFLNILLILKACPNANRVGGYRTWQSLGRQVKQKEKGIMILAPIFRKHSEDAEKDAKDEERSGLAGFRAVYVFEEQQTTGKDLPQLATVQGDPSFYLERLEAFTRSKGLHLEYSHEIAPAKGMAAKGKITLLPEQTAAETFATLAHELAHADLHFGDRRASTDKRIRETEAESVAYVVCSAIGLETGTAAADYVGLYGGDAKVLLASLEYVQATASRILDAITCDLVERAA